MTEVRRQEVLKRLCEAISLGRNGNPNDSGQHASDCFCFPVHEGGPQFEFSEDFLSFLCDSIAFAAQTYQVTDSDWLAKHAEAVLLVSQLDEIMGRAMVAYHLKESWVEKLEGYYYHNPQTLPQILKGLVDGGNGYG